MHRFYLPPDRCEEPVLFLTGSEAHHATRVLRLGRGAAVQVLDGAGRVLNCVIEDHDRDKVRLRVGDIQAQPPPACETTLVQALPKAKLIEAIIQKATELGVSRVVPLNTERVVARLSQREGERKAGKWQQVALEATKQCGTPWLPRVEAPATIAELLARGERHELTLVGALRSGSSHARECFEEFRSRHGRPPRSVCVWVGPEGDFTPAELDAIIGAGARPISLGPLVLRCETAATFCLSIIAHEISSPPATRP